MLKSPLLRAAPLRRLLPRPPERPQPLLRQKRRRPQLNQPRPSQLPPSQSSLPLKLRRLKATANNALLLEHLAPSQKFARLLDHSHLGISPCRC
jgi:hypothetical protein